MPKIGMVAGVRIAIWPNDHEPAHIHCFYAEHECKMAIATGDVLEGRLERAKLVAVRTWLDKNRLEVAFAWNEVMTGRGFKGMIR
ncbi:MAG: DUF4160 domain-containing protein [Rhizobiaceae bacterium]|jgi:hypothetical protein|nr:DUF4160 domain-containing protein [Rhizobiaceae bacterium]